MWSAAEPPETRSSAISTEDKMPYNGKLYLLDGQQRITSLATIMTGRPIRIRDEDEMTERHIEVYFNLEHPSKLESESDDQYVGRENAAEARNNNVKNKFFQVKNPAIANLPQWISVTKLFREGIGSILKDLKVSYDHPKYESYNSRLSQLYGRI